MIHRKPLGRSFAGRNGSARGSRLRQSSAPAAASERTARSGRPDVDELEELEAEVLDDDETDQPPDAEPLLSPTSGSILTASPLPPPPPEIDAEVTGDEVTMHLGHRRYRIRGLSKNLAFDQMKVNVLATTDKGMYVDTFDLYIARHRRQFVTPSRRRIGRGRGDDQERPWAACC